MQLLRAAQLPGGRTGWLLIAALQLLITLAGILCGKNLRDYLHREAAPSVAECGGHGEAQAAVAFDVCAAFEQRNHTYAFAAPRDFAETRDTFFPGMRYPKAHQSGIVMYDRALPSYKHCATAAQVISSTKSNCQLMVPVRSSGVIPYTFRIAGARTGALRVRPDSGAKLIATTLDEQLNTVLMIDELVSSFKRFAFSKGIKPGADVVIMCLNEAVIDLLLNLRCSQQRHRINVSKQTFLFVTSDAAATKMQSIGFNAFYHPALGTFPSNAAAAYGDNIFARMMLLKVTCVQMGLMSGMNVLFQDVDNVWFRNPLEYFRAQPPEIDMFFQDDGARTERYAPFYGNSGFYYVRQNWRTVRLFQRFFLAVEKIAATRSHQEVLSQLILEEYDLTGLTVKVLSDREFPQGEVYLHQKVFLRSVLSGSSPAPYIWHMCWTKNKLDKLRYFKEMGAWYLRDECTQSTLKLNPTLEVEQCCAPDDPELHFQVGRPYSLRKIDA